MMTSIESSIQADYFEEVKHKLKVDEYFQFCTSTRTSIPENEPNVKEVLDVICSGTKFKFIKE